MKINCIKKLSGNKYKVEFENGNSIIIYEDVILDNNLLYKKEIDDKLFKKIEKENMYYAVYNKTLKYVLTKMRSIYEVEKYLEKFDIKDSDKTKIINKLCNINLLNDKLYAEAFISDKINLSSDGPNKIKRELLSKRIAEDIIDLEFQKYDDTIFEDKIKKIISKKKNTKYSNYVFKQKINLYLINLGYDSKYIIPILNSLDTDTTNLIKKEYDSLYRKLSKKYSDEKLDYEIKSRLYKKGFNMDEINNIKE